MLDLNYLDNVMRQQEQQNLMQGTLARKAAESAQPEHVPDGIQSILDEMEAEKEREATRGRIDAFMHYASGGGIHIDPSKRGTFTAAASRNGMGVQEYAAHIHAHPENYSPEMRRKANFARNAAKWHHACGGCLNKYDGSEYSNIDRRLITLSQLPSDFVQQHKEMTVRPPKGDPVTLDEAFSRYGGTHVYVDDVPGLTDYLLQQPQGLIDLEHEILEEQRRRQRSRDAETAGQALWTSANMAWAIPLMKKILTSSAADAEAAGATEAATSSSAPSGISSLGKNLKRLIFKEYVDPSTGEVTEVFEPHPYMFRLLRDSPVPRWFRQGVDTILSRNNKKQWAGFADPDSGLFGAAGGGTDWGDLTDDSPVPEIALPAPVSPQEESASAANSLPFIVDAIAGNPADLLNSVNSPTSFASGGYIEDGLRRRGVTGFRVTSSYRGPNSKVGKAGKRSGHARTLKDGSSGAIDIVPVDKSPQGWAQLEQQLRNPEVQAFLNSFGGTILTETDPITMKKTGATGPHYHIGLGVRGGGNFFTHNHGSGEYASAGYDSTQPTWGIEPITIGPDAAQESSYWWSQEEQPQDTAMDELYASAAGGNISAPDIDLFNVATQAAGTYPHMFARGGNMPSWGTDPASMIEHFEGFRESPYRDGNGYSVGYGQYMYGDGANLDWNSLLSGRKKLSKQEAHQQVLQSVDKLKKQLRKTLGDDLYNSLTPGQLMGYLDTGYQRPASMIKAAKIHKKDGAAAAARALGVKGFDERNAARRAAFAGDWGGYGEAPAYADGLMNPNTYEVDPITASPDKLRQESAPWYEQESGLSQEDIDELYASAAGRGIIAYDTDPLGVMTQVADTTPRMFTYGGCVPPAYII